MRVLLVGGGGREAALAWKLRQSPLLERLFVTHENPAFTGATRLGGDLVQAAREEGIDLVVVGPEGPLAEGLVDRCEAAGILAFGPTRAAAQLEVSKGFAKAFMVRHGIPTARYAAGPIAEARVDGPCVIKADGLAAGKGVFICDSVDSARVALDSLAKDQHSRVVVEEMLFGEELSVLALCDGERAVLLPPAQDHKRRFDGDHGPNTGGMGAYAPAPLGSPELMENVRQEVILPALRGMAAEGHPFKGVLYAGMMITERGPMTLEFNTRFGDPECQPLMVLLDEDLLPLLVDCARGTLAERPLRLRQGCACCVVVVEEGYPEAPKKGAQIELDEAPPGVVVFPAGVDAQWRVSGGRVLGVTGLGPDLASARDNAYAGVGGVRFAGAAWRSDIAWRGMAR